MKRGRKIGLKLGARERILAFLALIIALAAFADRWVIRPYMTYRKDAEQGLAAKIDLLRRYEGILADKEYLLERMKTVEKVKQAMERRFLMADTEALASARLQKGVKDMASRNKVTVTRSTSYEGVELFKDGRLRLLPVRFEMSADTMSALSAMLYDIEYGKDWFLFIDELAITPLPGRRGEGVRGSLKVNAIVSIKT